MNIPTVSIGFPVYNGENYMVEAVNSALNQIYSDYELIISDNASTDNTMDICNTYVRKDTRIRYYRNRDNMGAAWNFNNVFNLARGKYFIWICHDDLWTPDLLERYVEVLDKRPDVVMCYSKTTFIDKDGELLYSVIGRPDLNIENTYERFRLFIKYHFPTNECSQVLGLFRTGMLKKTNLIGKYPSSDMILLGEIALLGKSYEIQDCLLKRREHSLKSTTAFQTMEDRAVWFDPTQKGKLQLTTLKWFFKWQKSVLKSPVGVSVKLKCIKEVWNWAWHYRVDIKKEVKSGMKRIIF